MKSRSLINVVNEDDYELDMHALLPQFASTIQDEFECSPVAHCTVYIDVVAVKLPLCCAVEWQLEETHTYSLRCNRLRLSAHKKSMTA